MKATHPCSVPGCGKLQPPHFLMCPWHWGKVPVAIREEVWKAWRDYKRDAITLDELRAVQARATDAVVAAEQAKGGAG